MLSEFYDYIAKTIVSFFQSLYKSIGPGERYCLKVDTDEMVEGVYESLQKYTADQGIQGEFSFRDVYETFTIFISDGVEVVVAAKLKDIQVDFLATLRNNTLTEKHFPILMITCSTLDTLTSGTVDLAANGMPFHAAALQTRIRTDIGKAQLEVSERELLQYELGRKQDDRYSDKSSLFEYSDLLSVLAKEKLDLSDFSSFRLIMDPKLKPQVDEKKIKERLAENHKFFDLIDSAVRRGDIEDSLLNKFEKALIQKLVKCRRDNVNWQDVVTFEEVKASWEKMRVKEESVLEIDANPKEVFSGMALTYQFPIDELVFTKYDDSTKSKSRQRNIIIYNPDAKTDITVVLSANKAVRPGRISSSEKVSAFPKKKEIYIQIKPEGCTFALVDITDNDNDKITYHIKICVLNIPPRYLENIQTCFNIFMRKNSIKQGRIQILNAAESLIINPGHEIKTETLEEDHEYSCNYDETLTLCRNNDVNTDAISIKFTLRSGAIVIPLELIENQDKSELLTGIGAFKKKFSLQRSFEYRYYDGININIVLGTKPLYAREGFKDSLEKEYWLVQNGWLAMEAEEHKYKEWKLHVPDAVRAAYKKLVDEFRKHRFVPSLTYYKGDLETYAREYVNEFEKAMESLSVGDSVPQESMDLMMLGCVRDFDDKKGYEMGPLHPLNILYHLELKKEVGVGNVRDDLVEKLTPLHLVPYLTGRKSNILFQAVEQRHSPEWRYYTDVKVRRNGGTRTFIPKLVCDKIEQYYKHFYFLFDVLEDRHFKINIVNMGGCRELFQGFIRYYDLHLRSEQDPESMLRFDINIYGDKNTYNDFSILSDLHNLKNYIKKVYNKGNKNEEDIGELCLALTSSIRCFFKSIDEDKYEYAHLTFYEMPIEDDSISFQMNLIASGASLNGLLSGTPSVLNKEWYKTGFGTKYAPHNELITLAQKCNAFAAVAYNGSSYNPDTCSFTTVSQDQEAVQNKIYESSNWVVFVDPKVDLTFFQKKSLEKSDLMIIHYSDQYSSASGYDDITVTAKSEQYNQIISEQLEKKGVFATHNDVNGIIRMFNAVNGDWLLRLITAKKTQGATDSYFSREKMSILSAIKLAMAYYAHDDIVWVPISLEEMLRVSKSVGLVQKDGLLSAKNLGFENPVACDDILLVGIHGTADGLKAYLHPVEVKIGQNESFVLNKAKTQVVNTSEGFRKSLWPDEGRDQLERKLSRNFLMQQVIVCAEKMKLYAIYPECNWDLILDTYRERLLNEEYEFSDELDPIIGKGTVVSFKTDSFMTTGTLHNDVCVLDLPEKLGASYMISSVSDIEKELEKCKDDIPERLRVKCKVSVEKPEENDIPKTDQTDKGNTATVEHDKAEKTDARTANPENAEKVEAGASEKASGKETTEKPGPETAEVSSKDDKGHPSEAEAAEKDRKTMVVTFGTDITTGQPVLWMPNDTSKLFHTNTGIIGTMGTGKTQFTKSLITQMYKDRKHNLDGCAELGILIFDYKGDYNESKEDFVKATDAKVLQPYHFPFNPLALTIPKVKKPLLPMHTANAFKESLSKVYHLGPKQGSALTKCILEAYNRKGIVPNDPSTWTKTPPTFDLVYKIYDDDEEIKKNDSLTAAMEKLQQFEIFEKDATKTQSLFDMLRGVVVIDLSNMDSDIQNLIVAITLELFYSQMQAAGSSKMDYPYRQLTKFILVDEADNFMSEGFPVLRKILKEGREFGVGTILSTQFLTHFGSKEDDYSKYILTWVVHNVADLSPGDVDFVFKTAAKSGDSQKLFNDIKNLTMHHSIVKMGNATPQYIEDKPFWKLFKEMYPDGIES